MMLQVDLGAEKRKVRVADVRRVAEGQENRARPAEVQQGGREACRIVGQRSRP